jgi:hypothetical protein
MPEYKCPECGSNVLEVEVPAKVTYRFTESGEVNEVVEDAHDAGEYSRDSWTKCTGCGLTGELREFDPLN